MKADPTNHIVEHKSIQHYNGFSKILAGDQLHHFGAIQAKVIKQLYYASFTESPWLCSKELLHKAGSRSIALRDLFKSQPDWQQLIESDRRGNYKLRLQKKPVNIPFFK